MDPARTSSRHPANHLCQLRGERRPKAERLQRRPKGERPSGKTLLAAILITAAIWSLVAAGDFNTFNRNGLAVVGQILLAAVTPDLSPDYLLRVVQDAVVTIAYAVVAMVFAAAAGSAGALAASGLAITGSAKLRLGTMAISRAILAVPRSIHELVWALIFVAGFGLTPWAGIFAIAVPYASILARIWADQLQDVPHLPVQALHTTGSSRSQLLLYGYLPQVYPQLFSYLMYRFECALRAAAVLSFVGLGGLGFRIQITLDDLHYSQAWTAIWMLILVIVAFDWLSRSAQGYFAK